MVNVNFKIVLPSERDAAPYSSRLIAAGATAASIEITNNILMDISVIKGEIIDS